MKGDFTRLTFDSRKHFSSVRMQQGRVQLDADWNEQMDIDAHRDETEAVDVIGRCGFPKHDPGFATTHQLGVLTLTNELLIGPGRGYVDGILCELEPGPLVAIAQITGNTLKVAPGALEGVKLVQGDWLAIFDNTGEPKAVNRVQSVSGTDVVCQGPIGALSGTLSFRRLTTFTTQPYLPKATIPTKGVYFAYLDVWRRHVTAVEDPTIQEVALGGPDTATRLQTVWQVRLVKVGDAVGSLTCDSEPNEWKAAIAPPTGKLRARTRPADDPKTPCIVPASAGFTLLENQLYRVEVHRSGKLPTPAGEDAPTFKWSRDNGSLATEWLSQTGDKLTVRSTGRDAVLRFEKGGWLELTDDVRDLRNELGELRQAKDVDGDVIEVATPVDINQFSPVRKVRRWDSAGAVTIEQPAANDGYLSLEGGIEVRFENGSYRTGDYWLIPARAFIGQFSGAIEWPQDGGKPLALAPHGIPHHFCKLALVLVQDTSLEALSDCRDLFSPLTENIDLVYVGGDGQEAGPNQDLPQPIEVRVADGLLPPRSKARVRFKIVQGAGKLAKSVGTVVSTISNQELILETDGNGLAACTWKLGTDTTSFQRVEAVLLENGQDIPGQVVHFNASFRDRGVEPGIHIISVQSLLEDKPIINDTKLHLSYFAAGIRIGCDQELKDCFSVLPETDNPIPPKPNVTVALYLPYPLLPEELQFWGSNSFGDFVIGFKPILLDGTVTAEPRPSQTRPDQIVWRPSIATRNWLEFSLFQKLVRTFLGPDPAKQSLIDFLLVRVSVAGNFIWGETSARQRVYLDGDAFGLEDRGRILLDLPSGDGRRGGDFEMWFWLYDFDVLARVEGVTVFGKVEVPNTSVKIFVGLMDNQGIETRQEITTNQEFSFSGLDPRRAPYRLRAPSLFPWPPPPPFVRLKFRDLRVV